MAIFMDKLDVTTEFGFDDDQLVNQFWHFL